MREFLGFVLVAAALSGQQTAETIRSVPRPAAESIIQKRSNIRVDTTLVLIPVSVLDPIGRYIISLEKENFRVFEDKVEQQVTQFSDEDAPLSMGIVFDTSGSMGSKLSKSRQAVRQVLKTANPEDEFFLVQFNDRPELTMPFTIDIRDVQSRLMYTQSKGRTALLDGVYLAMNQMKKARNPRKAILIISDGGDNSSRYTETEVKKNVREGDVQIFAMGIFEPMVSRGRTSEEMGGPALLGDLAEETGGRHFEVGNLAELPDVAEKIALALRKQYVLGYTPKNAVRDGKYRRVQVRLAKTSGLGALRAIFRTGYYAPTE